MLVFAHLIIAVVGFLLATPDFLCRRNLGLSSHQQNQHAVD